MTGEFFALCCQNSSLFDRGHVDRISSHTDDQLQFHCVRTDPVLGHFRKNLNSLSMLMHINYCSLDAVTNATTNENYSLWLSNFILYKPRYVLQKCHRPYYNFKNNSYLFNTFVTLI